MTQEFSRLEAALAPFLADGLLPKKGDLSWPIRSIRRNEKEADSIILARPRPKQRKTLPAPLVRRPQQSLRRPGRPHRTSGTKPKAPRRQSAAACARWPAPFAKTCRT